MLSGGDDAEPIGAVAAVQDDHLPVDPIETIPARLDLIAETGVDHDPGGRLLGRGRAATRPADPRNPSDPAYDFSRPDLIMLGARRSAGITPIVSVYDTPPWASGGVEEPVGGAFNKLAPDPADYADFMAALATRYSGEFTAPRRRDPARDPPLRGLERAEPQRLPDPAVGHARRRAHGGPARHLRGDGPGGLRARSRRPTPTRSSSPASGGRAAAPAPPGSARWTGSRGLAERKIPLDAYSQHVYPAAPPLAETSVVPSWSTIGRILTELDAFRPGLRPLHHRGRLHDGHDAVPRHQGHRGRAGRLPLPDLLAAAAPQRADQDGRLVQPPGQRRTGPPASCARTCHASRATSGSVGVVEQQGGTKLD